MKLDELIIENRRHRPARQLKIECDHCHHVFVTKYTSTYATQIQHFRTRKCSQAAHQHLRIAAAALPKSVAKRKITTLERFGVESVFSLPAVHALVNTPEKCRQRHLTMKKNGSYFNSKQEHAFYMWLISTYGVENVDRQSVINAWPIDFYVKSIDTYVQFDGEYWHGLDRPLSEISKFKTPRDKTILRKFQIDREQDEWFKSTCRRLIRITNRQFERGEFPDELK